MQCKYLKIAHLTMWCKDRRNKIGHEEVEHGGDSPRGLDVRSISINSISVGETAVATIYTHYAHLTRVIPAEIQYASQLSVLFKRKAADTLGHHTVGSPQTCWVIYERKGKSCPKNANQSTKKKWNEKLRLLERTQARTKDARKDTTQVWQ